jgi:hypothetical protein
MNFLIAGMRGETTYNLRHVLRDALGSVISRGPVVAFTTGTPDPALPTVTVVTAPGPTASLTDDILLLSANSDSEGAMATDLDGNPIWYYTSDDQAHLTLTRILPGGNMLVNAPSIAASDRDVLREIDLAGNIVRETNSRQVSEGLQALGQQQIGSMHHEARKLANGHLLVLGSTERILVDQQGPGPVDVLGDLVIDLDTDLQPVWAVNLFDILDVTRVAVLGETCTNGQAGCPPVHLADVANDWTHSNSIAYSPSDGNLIVSSRHQDWIIKVDYRDGQGTGAVLWHLGRNGDFSLAGEANDGWQSHQHDAHYIENDVVILYDNGNANPDCLADPLLCVSAGKAYRLDETAMIATPVLNADLHNFSFAIGAAQKLSNGNYQFDSGIYAGGFTSRSQEVDPGGNIVFELEASVRAYRSFRLQDMYTPPDG